MLELSRKEVAVGNSTDVVSRARESQPHQHSAGGQSFTEGLKQVTAGVPMRNVAQVGNRNGSEQTRYQAMTLQIINESYQSALSMKLKYQQAAAGSNGG